MGLRAPVTGSGDGPPRELPPPGSYLAVCNGAYMLGTQPGYQGGEAKLQLMLSFELHKRKGPMRDSQGRVMEATAIMNHTANIKSTLIDYAGALRGRSYTEDELKTVSAEGGFDPEELLGLSCRLEIEHVKKLDGGIRDKIATIGKLDPEDDVPPTPETDEVYWDWTLGEECPRRISYFWDRALENLSRKGESAYSGLPKPGSFEPAAAAASADVPF
jgi:hypothetical protein